MKFDKPERKVAKVFLHCSASDNNSLVGERLVEEIRHWHVDQNKWSDIGYHFLIDKEGGTFKGRNLEICPSAQKGHNTGSIAIMVHGLEEFTGLSMYSLIKLCKQINKAYDGNITFHGHCEVSNKTCPVYDYKTVLRLDEYGKMK